MHLLASRDAIAAACITLMTTTSRMPVSPLQNRVGRGGVFTGFAFHPSNYAT